jgi:hypothetical protein
MNIQLQKLCTWSGFVAMTLFFAGLLIMNFFPPLSPNLSPEQVAQVYQSHQGFILLGALIIVVSAMFAGPFDAAIFMQLRRLEGDARPVASYAQLASGIANIQFFILPGVLFVVAAFRPDRPLEVLFALNDLAWIVTMLPWTVGAMQCVCVGAAILIHGSTTTPYPRWLGYFNIWIAIGMATSSVIPFFKTGPFAWNGLVGFWIPATVFGLWMAVMWWMTLKAISTESGVEDAVASTGTV